MVKLSTYVKIVKMWITLFSYWAISTLVHAYHTRHKTDDYYFLISCLFISAGLGLITCGIIHWFDLHINFAPHVSSFDASNLSTDLTFEELHIQKQKELEELEKEKEEAIVDIYFWLATTLVVYCIVFSLCY